MSVKNGLLNADSELSGSGRLFSLSEIRSFITGDASLVFTRDEDSNATGRASTAPEETGTANAKPDKIRWPDWLGAKGLLDRCKEDHPSLAV